MAQQQASCAPASSEPFSVPTLQARALAGVPGDDLAARRGRTATNPAVDWCLTCCLCHLPVSRRGLVYVLDEEWARRNPGLTGRLSCRECVDDHQFSCRCAPGRADLRAVRSRQDTFSRRTFTSWDHITDSGPLKAMLLEYPAAAVAQGARAYVEFAVRRHTMSASTMAKVHRALGTDPGLLRDFVLVLDGAPSPKQRRALYRRHPECRIEGDTVTNAMLAPGLEQAVARMESDLVSVGWAGHIVSVLPVEG